VSGSAFAAGPTFMPGFPMRAGDSVMLMWMPFPGAASYNVYRSAKPGGPYDKIATSPANNFMDPNVPQDKSFYYVVKPVVGGKEGDSSAEVELKGLEPMKTPAFVGDLITPDNKISIRWEINPKAAFYNLYRSEAEKGDFKLLASVQDTKYTDGNVAVGKTYYYKVTSVSSTNTESPRSDKPLVVKLVKEAAEQKGVVLVQRKVEPVGTFDVDGQYAIRSPKDLAFDGDGNFYVSEGRGYVVHVDAKEMKVLKTLAGPPPDFKGTWGYAEGVYFDKKKRELYVVYTDADTIRVFDTDGNLKRSFSVGKPDPKVAPRTDWNPSPVDVAFGADGVVWVSDGAYFQLVGFNEKGEELKRIGLPREHKDRKGGDPNPVSPAFLAVSPKNGNIYVLEVAMQRVSVYDKDGKMVARIGGRGGQPGKFLLPAGIAVDENGAAYVADRNLERLQSFNESGEYTATYINPKKSTPERQVQIFAGALSVAVQNGVIGYSDAIGEKVVLYKIIP
jgi:DNA-binding beta-propeller fold protein YncE